MSSPKVTVLMPVYDGERYVREAMASILRQTFRDLELLVMDDGSRDASAAIVAAERDPRVRLHRNPRNLGLIETLNAGLELARGEYVARMDADDVAHPARLERQVRHLDAHPDVAVLGTGVRNFGQSRRSWTLKHDPPAVRARLLFECAVTHPSVMLRPDVLRRLGLRYDPAYPHAEDWALWAAVAERARVANLPEQLLRYRTHAGQVSHTHDVAQGRSRRRIYAFQLARLGIEASEPDLALHDELGTGVFQPSLELLDRADAWLLRIRDGAAALPPADRAALEAELSFRWARACRRSRSLGLAALRRFHASPLRGGASGSTRLQVALGAVAGALRATRAGR